MNNTTDTNALIKAQISAEGLPSDYRMVVEEAVLPLALKIQSYAANRLYPVWIGINGAQGTGKTTLVRFLQLLLQQHYSVVTMSLDDFYLGRSARIALANNVHPLLETRGVPGTHDLDLIRASFDALSAGKDTLLPQFDKSADDRALVGDWLPCTNAADIILFEGWCVGCPPQSPSELLSPVNELEVHEDSQGIWRTYVNNRLSNEYQYIFGQLDQLVMLRAPSFDSVYRWRLKQEQRLERVSGKRYFNDAELRRFVQHYERLTRHCLKQLPSQADYVIGLNEQHQVEEFVVR